MKLKDKLVEWEIGDDLPRDRAVGDRIARVVGDTFIEAEHMTPVEQWSRLAMILRLHGIDLTPFALDDKKGPTGLDQALRVFEEVKELLAKVDQDSPISIRSVDCIPVFATEVVPYHHGGIRRHTGQASVDIKILFEFLPDWARPIPDDQPPPIGADW